MNDDQLSELEEEGGSGSRRRRDATAGEAERASQGTSPEDVRSEDEGDERPRRIVVPYRETFLGPDEVIEAEDAVAAQHWDSRLWH